MAPEGTPVQHLDRDLVLNFQNGDERAYAEIFKRYHGRVWGICKRMLPTAQDAEEATQETFLKAYQALGRFNGSFYLGAWLSRIATNVCVDHLRSKAKSNLVALSDEPDDLVMEPGPEQIVVGEHPRLQQAIEEIQPLHASVLALRTLEGLSHQEIAGHLQMSPSQVKALLHRARCSLRRAWDKAEGWAVAPVLGVRHLLSDRSTGEAARLASMSPSAAPFIIERVAAASAIIVAAALTGLPLSPGVDPTERSERPSRVLTAPFRSQEATEPASRPAPVAAAPTRRVGPVAAAPVAAPAPVANLTAQIEKTLEETKQPKPPEDPPEDPPDDPIGPTAAEGEKTVKKVRKTVDEALEEVVP